MNDSQRVAILRKALVDVVQKLGEMPGWISVKQELPPTGYCVVVWKTNSRESYTARYQPVTYPEFPWRDKFGSGDGPSISHWQPLPCDPSDSTPTLAETLQAICASALGDTMLDETKGDQ